MNAQKSRSGCKNGGFTVVELMIVLIILAVLMSVGIPAYQKYRERLDVTLVTADFVQINLDMARYYADRDAYPPDLESIGADKLDPWGTPYQYLNMALANGNGQKRKDHNLVPLNTDFDLYSMGPDKRSVSPLTASHSRDDIIRANNGQYIGLASDY
jgi:general secretion pathway protein G